MTQRTSRMILGGLLGLAIFAVAMGAVEVYLYSWLGAGMDAVGRCNYKSFRATGDNGQPVTLSFPVDPQLIDDALKTNPDYRISGNEKVGWIKISRDFGHTTYEIAFKSSAFGGYDGLILRTTMAVSAPNDAPSLKCSVPDRVIRGNAYAMIDDLPLSGEQKKELRAHVIVRRSAPPLFRMP